MTWNDHPNAPKPGTVLCPLRNLKDGCGTGFDFGADDNPFRLFVVRQDTAVFAYVNACAHFGVELNPGRDHTFLTPDGTAIRCQHHGAQYAIADGRCLKGECDGVGLHAIPIVVLDGNVTISNG